MRDESGKKSIRFLKGFTQQKYLDTDRVSNLFTAILETAITDLKTKNRYDPDYKSAKSFINHKYSKLMMEHLGVNSSKIHRALKKEKCI